MAYKYHTMGKGKARVTTRNKAAHDALEKDGWGHGPFKMKGFSYPGESPIMKKVPNCVPLKSAKGKKKGPNDPCWAGYVQLGMKDK